MQTIAYRLRVVAPYLSARDADLHHCQEQPLIQLHAVFSMPERGRGSVMRTISPQMLLEGLRAGCDVVAAERALLEKAIAQASGRQPWCAALRLPPGWKTLRGPDRLVTALWPRVPDEHP